MTGQPYVPLEWPKEVEPPGADGFGPSAVAWIFTLLPAEYADHEVLHRYPSAVVHLARHLLVARYEATRHAYRTVRQELSDDVPPQYLETIAGIYREEGARLRREARALDLADRAVRGERLGPRSRDPARWFPAPFWLTG